MNEETWKPVVGFETLYEVSSFGRVRSVDRVVQRSSGALLSLRGRLLKAGRSSNGYLSVALCSCGIPQSCNVHVLVAKAFVPNPHNHPLVDHEDLNRQNNQASNLRWSTYSGNSYHTPQPEGRGVVFVRRYPHRPWIARMARKNIGHFATKEEAQLARKMAYERALNENFHR